MSEGKKCLEGVQICTSKILQILSHLILKLLGTCANLYFKNTANTKSFNPKEIVSEYLPYASTAHIHCPDSWIPGSQAWAFVTVLCDLMICQVDIANSQIYCVGKILSSSQI
jgi:hypothetical protein